MARHVSWHQMAKVGQEGTARRRRQCIMSMNIFISAVFVAALGACVTEPLILSGNPVPATYGCDNITGAPLTASGDPDVAMVEIIGMCREKADRDADSEFVTSILRGTSAKGGLTGDASFDDLVMIHKRERIIYLNCLREAGVPESCAMAQ